MPPDLSEDLAKAQEEIACLKAELAAITDRVRYWSHCTSEGMLATCPEQVQELADFFIDLGIAPWYVRNSCCETVRVPCTEEWRP
jgi:hypothetical protein